MSPCAKLCVLALLACVVNSAPVPEEEGNTEAYVPAIAAVSSDGQSAQADGQVPSDAQVTKRQAEEATVDDAQTPEGQGLETGQNPGAFFAPEQGAQDPTTLTQESSQFNAEATIPQGQEASVSKRQAETSQVEGLETNQQDAQFVQPEGQVVPANDESQVAESSLPQQEVTSVSKRQVEELAENPQADGQLAEADGQPISASEGQFFAPLSQDTQPQADPAVLTQGDSQVAAEGSSPQEGQTVAKRQVQEAQSSDADQAQINPDLESQSFEGAAVQPQADAPAEIPTQDEVSQGAEDAQSKLTKRQSPDPYNAEVIANKDRKDPCVLAGDDEEDCGLQAGLRQVQKSDEGKRPKRQGSFASAGSGTDYGGFGGYGGGSESEAQSQSASFSVGPFQASFSESEASSQSGNQGYNNYGGGYGNGGFSDY